MKHIRWTSDEDQKLRRLWQAGQHDGEIAERLPGRNKDHVRYRRAQLDLGPMISPGLQLMMRRINARRKLLQI